MAESNNTGSSNHGIVHTVLVSIEDAGAGVLKDCLLSKHAMVVSLGWLFCWHVFEFFRKRNRKPKPVKGEKVEAKIDKEWCEAKVLEAGSEGKPELKYKIKFMQDKKEALVERSEIRTIEDSETPGAWDWLRTFALACVVVQIYFSPPFPFAKENPFCVSCAAITADCFSGLVGKLIEKVIGPGAEQITPRPKKEFHVKNQYQDLSQSFTKVTMFFFVQLCLTFYYVFTLNEDIRSHDKKQVHFFRWVVACLLVLIVGEDNVGSAYDWKFWKEILAHRKRNKDTWIVGCIKVSFEFEWTIRRTYSFIINMMARNVILGTAPLWLSTSGPMDFVKDCLALFFITKLDDLDDAKKMSVDQLDEDDDEAPVTEADSPLRTSETEASLPALTQGRETEILLSSASSV